MKNRTKAQERVEDVYAALQQIDAMLRKSDRRRGAMISSISLAGGKSYSRSDFGSDGRGGARARHALIAQCLKRLHPDKRGY